MAVEDEIEVEEAAVEARLRDSSSSSLSSSFTSILVAFLLSISLAGTRLSGLPQPQLFVILILTTTPVVVALLVKAQYLCWNGLASGLSCELNCNFCQ